MDDEVCRTVPKLAYEHKESEVPCAVPKLPCENIDSDNVVTHHIQVSQNTSKRRRVLGFLLRLHY
jgi:hypothetical protein